MPSRSWPLFPRTELGGGGYAEDQTFALDVGIYRSAYTDGKKLNLGWTSTWNLQHLSCTLYQLNHMSQYGSNHSMNSGCTTEGA